MPEHEQGQTGAASNKRVKAAQAYCPNNIQMVVPQNVGDEISRLNIHNEGGGSIVPLHQGEVFQDFLQDKLIDIPPLPENRDEYTVCSGIKTMEYNNTEGEIQDFNLEEELRDLLYKKYDMSKDRDQNDTETREYDDKIAEFFEKIITFSNGGLIKGVIENNEGARHIKDPRSTLGQSFRSMKNTYAFVFQQEGCLRKLGEMIHGAKGGCATRPSTILIDLAAEYRVNDSLEKVNKIAAKIMQKFLYQTLFIAARDSDRNTGDMLGMDILPGGIDAIQDMEVANAYFSPCAVSKAIAANIEMSGVKAFKIILDFYPDKLGSLKDGIVSEESQAKMAELASYAVMQKVMGAEVFADCMHYIFKAKAMEIQNTPEDKKTGLQADFDLMKEACADLFGEKAMKKVKDVDFYEGVEITSTADFNSGRRSLVRGGGQRFTGPWSFERRDGMSIPGPIEGAEAFSQRSSTRSLSGSGSGSSS